MRKRARGLRGVPALAAAALLLMGPGAAEAQLKASEEAAVSQTVDGTVMTLTYSRPSLRGRGDLFGGQIRWGEVWTPGANWATIFEASKDVTVEGRPVPAGRYSVWMVVEEDPSAWELVLDPRDSLWHTVHPGPTDDQIRVPVERAEAESSVETLTWYFPAVRATGADLRMHWGDTEVEVEVGVEPSFPTTVTAEEAEPYLGRYRVIRIPRPEWAEMGMTQDTSEMTIRWEDEQLIGAWLGLDPTDPERTFDFLFLPRGGPFFFTGFMMDGELVEVLEIQLWEFLGSPDEAARGFEVRGQDDVLEMQGERTGAPSG